jgi:tetratricopeptide (TPR) repeat protein
MARAGEVAVAEEELRAVRAAGDESWDVHVAAGELEIARERWRPALAELLQAQALNPSNALVHFRLSGVYGALRDESNAETHMRRALELDRGEFGRDLRRQTEFSFEVMDALAQATSSAPGSLEALRRRAEAGDLAAQLAMAKACAEAQPPRTAEGMRWLRKAAMQGDDQAQYNYARNLVVLRGEKAVPEAVQWLNKSAAQGNADAQYRLGLILYDGKVVTRDNVTAAQWVYLAADHKHVEARRLLKEMQLFLSAADLAEARKRADDFQPVQRTGCMPEK